VNALRGTGLGASHPSERGSLQVFRDVTIEVPRGTTLGIFGPNGAGKTTLVRGIAGLLPIDGTVTYPAPRQGRSRPTIACVPQGFAASFYPWASLETNLLLHLPEPATQLKRNRRAIREAQDRLGLSLDLSLRPSECSGGMLQQAALVRAFARRPDVLVADEPFSALDFDVASRVRQGFRRTVSELGVCALLVLHNIEDLLDVCDVVLAIPGRPYTTNAALAGYVLAQVLSNSHPRDDRRGPTAPSAAAGAPHLVSPVGALASPSPFLAAIRKAMGSP
jgi:ABC-type nitrate/sulfonate/bicarbonate transport system ATPase subunit